MHYAPKKEGGYGTPVAVPGAVSIALSPKGDVEIFYADGVEYHKASGNEGYEGDWELAMIPDQFRKDILKEIEDDNKVLIENVNEETEEFALGFDIDGNSKTTRFWFYDCSVARPGTEAKTTEGKKTPLTDKLSISCAPLENGVVRAKTTADTTSTVYTDWYKQVYNPAIAESVGA